MIQKYLATIVSYLEKITYYTMLTISDNLLSEFIITCFIIRDIALRNINIGVFGVMDYKVQPASGLDCSPVPD